jgi:Domain of unknown function (DUF4337)
MDAPELPNAESDPLNRRISIIVALSATFLSICNVKDSNICQAMIDTWNYFQAKSTKGHLAEAAAAELEAIALSIHDPEGIKAVEALRARWKADALRYEADKKGVEDKARAAEAHYAALNLRDDQFDMAEASLSLAVALMGITALTRQRWLLAVGAAFALFGALMGVAGFTGLPLHPDFIAAWLS